MLGPPAITDNLAARVVGILIGSFIVVALAVSVLMLWPRPGEEATGLFQLPLPEETVAIVQAVETASPATRPIVVRALNTSAVSVRIAKDFPPIPQGLERVPRLEARFQSYSEVLEERPFRVDLRRGLLPAFLSIERTDVPASVQLSIVLRDGEVLIIDRRPPVLIRSYIVRAAATATVIGLVLLGALALAVRQTARPVNRLALAVRAFSLDSDAPDLPTKGPRELRELSSAFNEMQHRIRVLVADRTRLLGAVAHDLRTYLTRLRLRAEFITDADQRVRAERDIEEMAQLLDDILLFAQHCTKPDADVPLIDVGRETADFVAVRGEIGEAVVLVGEAGPGLTIRCPPLAFRRMLSNLTENALRYGGAARPSLTAQAAHVEVAVEDDGPGVPEAALEHILRPFERLESSRARSTGGAGLGLAIVKGLADSVSGQLSLANRPEGGLRATLRFAGAREPTEVGLHEY